MPNHENLHHVVITGIGGQQVTLGDGYHDRVDDFSAGLNTIALGDGNFDLVTTHADHDTITLGEGFADAVFDYKGLNTVILGAGDHDHFVAYPHSFGDIVTLGSGNDDSVVNEGPGGNTFILGAGANDTVLEAGSGFFPDTIIVGGGAYDGVALRTDADTVTGGVTGLAFVTFGGSDATLDLNHTFGSSFYEPTSPGQTSIVTDTLDIIRGLVKGDKIYLPFHEHTLVTASNLAGVVDKVAFAAGTYSASTHTFTASATGHDALLTYGGGFDPTFTEHFLSVVLVGAAADIAGSTMPHEGVIILG